MIEHLSIKLDRPDETYLAGSMVTGSLVVGHGTSLNLLELSLTFRGESRTRWTNKNADNVYESVDYPLNTTVFLNDYAGEFGGKLGVLDAPFRFVLPRHLPSSFYNDFGWIAYVIEGVITVAASKQGTVQRQYNTDRSFRVVGSLNLASDRPDLLRPVEVEDSVEIIGCCRSKGVVRAHLDLPGGGFDSGQMINAELRVNASKGSRGDDPSVSLSLCQQLQFTAQSLYTMNFFDRKEIMVVLTTIKGKEVKSSRKEHVDKIMVPIPADCIPTTMLAQQLITVNYFLKLEACGLELLIPILIGTSNRVN